jgi:hypothetical protein
MLYTQYGVILTPIYERNELRRGQIAKVARGSSYSGDRLQDTNLVLSTIVYLDGVDEKLYVMVKCDGAQIPNNGIANSFFSGHFIQEHIGSDDPNAQYKQ